MGEPYTVGPLPQGVVLADVNGDGADDLLVPNEGGTTISVLIARAVGASIRRRASPPDRPRGDRRGDVNGDGKVDLVVPNYGNTVSILLGDGSGASPRLPNYRSRRPPTSPTRRSPTSTTTGSSTWRW